jgi:hypothetical protein
LFVVHVRRYAPYLVADRGVWFGCPLLREDRVPDVYEDLAFNFEEDVCRIAGDIDRLLGPGGEVAGIRGLLLPPPL